MTGKDLFNQLKANRLDKSDEELQIKITTEENITMYADIDDVVDGKLIASETVSDEEFEDEEEDEDDLDDEDEEDDMDEEDEE